jgi:hypothetical protein
MDIPWPSQNFWRDLFVPPIKSAKYMLELASHLYCNCPCPLQILHAKTLFPLQEPQGTGCPAGLLTTP